MSTKHKKTGCNRIKSDLESNPILLGLVQSAWVEKRAIDLPGYIRGLLTFERRLGGKYINELIFLVQIAFTKYQ